MRIGKIILLMVMILIVSASAYAEDRDPTVQITATPSTLVGSSVSISMQATDVMDNAGIQRLEFYVNGYLDYTKDCARRTPCGLTRAIVHTGPTQERYHAIAIDNGNNLGISPTINVTFLGVDMPPVISPLPDRMIYEDSGMNGNLTDLWAYVTDSWNTSDQLTYSIIYQENTSLANCFVENNMYINCTTVDGNATGFTDIIVNVFDGRFNSNDTFELEVVNVNDLPFIMQPIPMLFVTEDTSNLTINMSQYIMDIDGPTLTFSFISNTSVLIASMAGEFLNLTALNNFNGIEPLMIIADDSLNQTNTTTNVTVIPINDIPYFNESLTNQTAIVDLPFNYRVNASDVDIGDVLTYTDNSTLFVINPATGQINFTPTITEWGNHSIFITVCDNSAALNDCNNQTFNLEVIYIPRPGFVNNTPLNVTYEDPGYYELFIDIVPYSILDTVLFEYSGANVTAELVSGNKYKANISNVPAGTYFYRWYANYTNSLDNTSIIYNLTVLPAIPQLLMSVLPGSPVEYGTVTNVSCYSNTSQISTLTLSLNGNPVLNPDIRTNLSAGYNNYTCTTPGNQNYTVASETRFLNVTPRIINMTFNGPTGSLPYGTITNFNCSIDFNQTTPVLMLNGTTVSNPDIAMLGVGSYNYTCSVAPTSNWYGVSETKLIDITPLTTTLTLNAPVTLTYGLPMNVNCSVDNNQSVVQLSRDGTGVSNPDTTSLNAGYYNYTCTGTGTPNYTDASVTNFVNITRATPLLTLLLNGTDGNVYLPIGGGSFLINSTISAAGETIDLYVNNTFVTSSATQILFVYPFTFSGWSNVTVQYSGAANYNPVSKTHYVAVGSPLVRYNFNPVDQSHFNTTSFTLSFNTNLNTSCRWAFTDLDYNAMTTDFTTTGLTTHSGLISGLVMGGNNVYASCVNDTAATNENLLYTVDNIIDSSSVLINSFASGSRITTTTLDNSVLTNVNTTNSIFNRSTLTNCVVINSTVKDYTGNSCVIINSVVDPSDVSGSTIIGSIIMNSNATNSYIDGSSITNSNVDNANVVYSTFLNITMNGGSVTNTNIQDAILTDAVIDNGVITGGTITQGGTTYNASINGTANLTQIINLPPLASFTMPSTAAPGAVVSFDASASSDPNIGQSGPFNSTNLTYSWDFGDGNTSTGVSTTHTYNAEASYVVTLTVTDAYSLSDNLPQTITISTPVTPPPPSSGGGGGGGGGGGYGFAARTYTYDLDSGVHFQRSLSPYDTLIIKYDNKNYTYKIAELTRNDVSILINDGIQKLINKEIRKIDLNNDHYYDMEIAFLQNYVLRAEFRLRPVQELVPGYSPFAEPKPATKTVVHETTEPEPIAEEPEEVQEVELEEPGLLSTVWDKIKNFGGSITGAVVGVSDAEESGGIIGWIIALAVIIIGIVGYWVYTEWF